MLCYLPVERVGFFGGIWKLPIHLPFVLTFDLLEFAFQGLYFGVLGVALCFGSFTGRKGLAVAHSPALFHTTLPTLLQTHWSPCIPSHSHRTHCLQQFFLPSASSVSAFCLTAYSSFGSQTGNFQGSFSSSPF